MTKGVRKFLRMALWGRQRRDHSSSDQSSSVSFSCTSLPVCSSLSIPLSPPPKCLFRSSPFDPIQTPLFSYPSTYGEKQICHTNPSFLVCLPCLLLRLLDGLEGNPRILPKFVGFTASEVYAGKKAQSFGGNFCTQKRIPHFDCSDV
ncbi:hypothetical protein RHMOL_Rhmol02G0188300 [Rhododendron molle]|uniref:Uncharacterized protein n=1 Tax=Rhododendron molle TaxID=49168 RepID=A0ACC0PRF4_RHOML|nr:hypothetical protein RHMOL_Rhmol02G0188300 [Rhododendron molle]